MTKRRLPIGVQNFREIREGNCYYVDKTGYLARLLEQGKHYFLSRPRRFGKSLFLDTCKELFEANEPLFEGLAIHGDWDWSVRHPVLHLSFGSGPFLGAGRPAHGGCGPAEDDGRPRGDSSASHLRARPA